jgi:hypothetical protein
MPSVVAVLRDRVPKSVADELRDRVPASAAAAVRARLGVDPRALAALRVALGLLVLADLALRARDLTAFYTDAGVLPRTLLFDLYPTVGRLSLFALSGSVAWAAALFLLTAGVAVALVAGYRSRLAACCLFVLLLSVHARNLPILNAGDSLLRRLLLWGALLPLGARWGLDAKRGETGRDRVVSIATAGLLVQAFVVYAVNAVIKLRGEAWRSGDAVRYVFGVDALTVGLGDALAGQATLLTLGAHAWLALLVASPLLLVATGRARTALVAAFAGGHLFMAATLNLGVFPLVSVAALLAFLPPAVWDRVETVTAGIRRRLAATRTRRPTPGRPLLGDLDPPATRTVAALLFAFVLVWNAASVGLVALPAATGSVDAEQRRWDMFAPAPLATDGWHVPVGTTTDGEQVDALRGGPPDRSEPSDPSATYPSHRWYVYLTELRSSPGLRPGFADYLCARWNRTHASDLASVELVVGYQPVRLDAPEPTRYRSMGTYRCGVVGARE